MVTETDGLGAFDQRVYQALSATATKYYRETLNRSNLIPMATTPGLDQEEYKKPIFLDTKGIKGGTSYSDDGGRATTGKRNRLYELGTVYMGIYYGPDEIMLEGQYLAQSKQEKMEAFARTIDLSLWKGVYANGYNAAGVGQGTQQVDGILDQAGTVTALNGTDSTLNAQGDVFKALTKMVNSIPFRYRDGREMVIGMTSNFFAKANGSLFTFDGGATEWMTFFDQFITRGVAGFKVSPNVIVSDEVFTFGTDTGGETDDRLFIMIPAPGLIERAFSRKMGLMGSVPARFGGIDQGWGSKLRGCVHDDEAVLYSEPITWA